jgi:putative sterol carrier protein
MATHDVFTLPPSPPLDRLPPEIRERTARYRFDLDNGRSFVVTLDRGRLALDEGSGETDCIVKTPADLFPRLLSGEANLLTAFMRGDAAMTGDLDAAKRLYRFLRLAQSKEFHP